jgi:hypothetical protein
MKYIYITLLLFTISLMHSQDKSINLKVNNLLKKMTLEEK